MHPAVRTKRRGSVRGILVIAFHDVVATYHDLAFDARRPGRACGGIDDLGFVAVRLSGTADLAPARIVGIGEARRVGLRHAERFDEADSELLLERAMELRRER